MERDKRSVSGVYKHLDNTEFKYSSCRENVVLACLPKDLFKKQKACQSFEMKEDYSFKMFQRLDNVFAVKSFLYISPVNNSLRVMENLTLEDMADFEHSELVETIKSWPTSLSVSASSATSPAWWSSQGQTSR